MAQQRSEKRHSHPEGGKTHSRFLVPVILTCSQKNLRELNLLLQEGFFIDTETGITLQETFLSFGFSHTYIKERIQTVFLNNSPVDDFMETVTFPGDTLSLSGAMPRLVGAVMRAGSHLAPFRKNITRRKKPRKTNDTTAFITLKLFNIILAETGAVFLKRGVILKAEQLNSFFSSRDGCFFSDCYSLHVKNRSVAPAPGALKDTVENKKTALCFFTAVEADDDRG